MGLNVLESSLEHELHCQHHQGHMAVPGLFLSGLVLRHSDMTLRILKSPLDPEPLRLHLHQSDEAGFLRGVTQAVLDGSRRVDFPSDHQVPTVGGWTVFVPQPDSLMQYFDLKPSFGRVAQSLSAPAGGRLLLDPLANLHRSRITHVTDTRPAPVLGRQVRSRITEIYVSVRMHVSYEGFSLFLQGLQKFQGIPIPAVNAHPIKANPAAARVDDDLLSQLQLGSTNLLRSWNVGTITSSRILGPFLRQIQSRNTEAHTIGPSQGTEPSTLTGFQI